MDGGGAPVAGGMQVEGGAAAEGAAAEEGAAEEEAPPVAFEDFKKAHEEKSKAEKEAREREEEEARAAARHARMLQNQASEVVDGEEELKGLVRGYKKRADGSTT